MRRRVKRGLPLPDGAPEDHPKVQELRDLAQWSEGMVWCSPERHGAMPGIMKAQINWVPLSVGSVRPTQGKTLALMEVSGGSQSFNAVNQLRVLGRSLWSSLPRREGCRSRWWVIAHGDGQRLVAARLVLFIRSCDRGHLLDAGGTTCRPEVDQNHPAAQGL